MSWTNTTVVSRLPTVTRHITGLRTCTRGSSFVKASTVAWRTMAPSHMDTCRARSVMGRVLSDRGSATGELAVQRQVQLQYIHAGTSEDSQRGRLGVCRDDPAHDVDAGAANPG